MDSFFGSMNISASGLAAQRLRMNILSSNLANAQTTRTPEGGPYKRQDVIFTAKPDKDNFEEFLGDTFNTTTRNVQVTGIFKDNKEPKKIFDPQNPDADKEGYVRMPNIQMVTEMVNMITATRAYEANTTAFNEAKNMALKTLELGK